MEQKAEMYSFETFKDLNKFLGLLWKIHLHRGHIGLEEWIFTIMTF